ncbi:hypothetical protein M0812_12195 [Anaeramoeba flamelloides]|uniref:Uncharacterized protein n=1 Tax=Anaeramoeba flamelloides TaxID=1746091 RepID=A0AAV7ZMA7_9EUKA|nr:hypothetical protein M0812_12195 [Anaeramoeba flamelloides]
MNKLFYFNKKNITKKNSKKEKELVIISVLKKEIPFLEKEINKQKKLKIQISDHLQKLRQQHSNCNETIKNLQTEIQLIKDDINQLETNINLEKSNFEYKLEKLNTLYDFLKREKGKGKKKKEKEKKMEKETRKGNEKGRERGTQEI